LRTYGNPDTFQLLCKAWSQAEGWMKSTKVMEIPGAGCIVQVTTQQGYSIAEALTFVPNVKLEDGQLVSGLPAFETPRPIQQPAPTEVE
jgi:hypothetical protein